MPNSGLAKAGRDVTEEMLTAMARKGLIIVIGRQPNGVLNLRHYAETRTTRDDPRKRLVRFGVSKVRRRKFPRMSDGDFKHLITAAIDLMIEDGDIRFREGKWVLARRLYNKRCAKPHYRNNKAKRRQAQPA